MYLENVAILKTESDSYTKSFYFHSGLPWYMPYLVKVPTANWNKCPEKK